MRIVESRLAGLYEIIADPFVDARGFMCRVMDQATFDGYGLRTSWVQESHSHTAHRHTLRGIHVSLPPAAESKMVTGIRGRMWWIAVDVRRTSATLGQWHGIELSPERHNSVYAETGFAHGCVALSDGCDLLLRADQAFAPGHATGIRWDDPDLAIDWRLDGAAPQVSDAHQTYPSFADFIDAFGGIDP